MGHNHVSGLTILGVILFGYAVFAKDCSVNLKGHRLSDVYLNHLKWVEPKSSRADQCPNGQTVTLECPTGFLDSRLPVNSIAFGCNNGVYNGSYQLPDLMCKNDFQKHIKVEGQHAAQLRSAVLKCDAPGFKVYDVKKKTDEGDVTLYKVCLDKNTMRTKFAMKPATPGPTAWQRVRPVQRQTSRDSDVWGFDGLGASAEERMVLSQVYVKKIQQERTSALFPDLTRGKTYQYYFNRGHLVAFRDFYDYEDQKGTVQYLNAAPQWDVMNKHSWSLVEQEARTIVEASALDWEIYTGTYGVIQTPRGQMFIGPNSSTNKARSAKMPVPQLFWKLVYNKKTPSRSRAFIGVNNPAFRTVADIQAPYILCPSPTRASNGKAFQGDEYHGFTYECPYKEFLAKLKAQENIVK